MKLSDFASDKHPLHCSRIPEFMTCPWKTLMSFLQINTRDGGSAAQTGTALHKAVSEWHNTKEVKEALQAMKALGDVLPLADFADAERLFQKYIADPRNQEAQVVHSEILLQGSIDRGIVLEGTADQIREEEGTWKVIDLKTSRLAGAFVRNFHTYQLAAYAYLASKRFKRPVLPGSIIMVRAYEKQGQEAYFPYDLTTEDVNALMEMVATRVRDVRVGDLVATPGDTCNYCIGVTSCLSKLREFKNG